MKNKVIGVTVNKRLFSGRNGISKVVTIIPLSSTIDPKSIIEKLCDSISVPNANVQNPGLTTVYADRFKQNLTFMVPPLNFMAILDAAKVADFVLFALSATDEVNEFGELCIRSIESQGVSTVFPLIYGLGTFSNQKKQIDTRISLYSYFKHFFPDCEKIYCDNSSSDMLNLSRSLCQKYPKGINWRDERPYVLADTYYWEADDNSDSKGYLVVEGVIRGKGIDPNRLVHIPGFGDYGINKIIKQSPNLKEVSNNEIDNVFLPDELQDSLNQLEEVGDEEMEHDDYNGNDTYEFEQGVTIGGHKYFNDDNDGNKILRPRGLPKGMSSYQARWIIDDELISDSELTDEESRNTEDLMDEDFNFENGTKSLRFSDQVISEYEPSEIGDNQTEAFIDLTEEEEEKQLKEFRQLARDNLHFPDEIELHPSVSAKERMARYRGEKSLRTSVWNVDERDPRAPSEWPKLLRIKNFKGTRNRVLRESIQNARVEVGSCVKIYIKADQHLVQAFGQSPLILFGLLQYENKLGVVNFTIQQTEYAEPIASKECLIAQCGPRRLIIRPIFSQSGNTPNNVYKYQRFIYPGDTATATVIAPLMFGNFPTVFFKQNEQKLHLVGTGSVLNADHSRVLAKRSVLTGHPFKIHKRVVTIRYMFFSREDILWFKAVPLFTRMGNSGVIKEPLGTHGYFKATFDRKMNPQDTIAMALYKRIWPKVSTLWNGNEY